MNNPSPLVPQGSNLEQKNSSRTRVRLAVYCVLSIHVVGLMALLMIGCRKPQTEEVPVADTNTVPVMEAPANVDTTALTNTYVAPVPETNTYVAPVPTPVAGQEYTVIKGDSFATIVKKFPGVTVKQLQEANPTVVPTKLQIGQKLHIPAPSSTAPTAAAPTADTTASADQLYTVKSGDTLTTIATHLGTTVKALRTANNLTTDKIRVGQKLKIPAKGSTPVEATPMTNP
jgi:LysM repeat protein